MSKMFHWIIEIEGHPVFMNIIVRLMTSDTFFPQRKMSRKVHFPHYWCDIVSIIIFEILLVVLKYIIKKVYF